MSTGVVVRCPHMGTSAGVVMGGTTLGDVERLVWRLSGWEVEQVSLNAVLKAVRDHAEAHGVVCDCAAHPGMDAHMPPQAPQEAVYAPLTPMETPAAPQAPAEAQAPVQRVEVSGTVTVVCGCAQGAGGTPQAPPVRQVRAAPAHSAARPMKEAGAGPGRVCRKCGHRWALEEFARDRKGPDGRRTACRACENTRRREADQAARARRGTTE